MPSAGASWRALLVHFGDDGVAQALKFLLLVLKLLHISQLVTLQPAAAAIGEETFVVRVFWIVFVMCTSDKAFPLTSGWCLPQPSQSWPYQLPQSWPRYRELYCACCRYSSPGHSLPRSCACGLRHRPCTSLPPAVQASRHKVKGTVMGSELAFHKLIISIKGN